MAILPERTTASYGPAVTAASKSALVELFTTLRAYRDALVLVGGWAPYFLLARHQRRDDPFVHIGSIDIDLAVDPERLAEPEYATIAELLAARGYRPTDGRRGHPVPSSFERLVPSPVTHKPYLIRVDFLTRPDGPGRSLSVQDGLLARKLKGCEAAFGRHEVVEVTGRLPGGGDLTVPVRVADLVAMLTMKGIVLGERYREKDAYDIYALIKHYGEGPRAVAEHVRPHLADPLVREGLTGIRRAFAARQAHGPAWVAGFLVAPVFAAEHARVVTDSFMTVAEALAALPEHAPSGM